MAHTGSTSMLYNASSTRFKTTVQQEYTWRKVDNMHVITDVAGLFYSNTSGPSYTVPFADYAILFTNSSGSFYPTPSRLGKSFKSGTKWNIIGSGTRLKYEGKAFMGHAYAHVSIRPDASENRILTVPVQTPGSGYTVAPTVSFSGSGSDATATAILNEATQQVASIRVDNGGTGWADSGTTATLTGAPNNASAGTVTVGKRTSLIIAIFKNGNLLDIDATTSVIGDPTNAFTSIGTIRFLGPIEKNDVFDLRIKTDSTSTHAYHIYQAALNIVPFEFEA